MDRKLTKKENYLQEINNNSKVNLIIQRIIDKSEELTDEYDNSFERVAVRSINKIIENNELEQPNDEEIENVIRMTFEIMPQAAINAGINSILLGFETALGHNKTTEIVEDIHSRLTKIIREISNDYYPLIDDYFTYLIAHSINQEEDIICNQCRVSALKH